VAEIQPVCVNRRARHDYHIDEFVEAGLVLTGTEVKSVRDHHVSLKEAFAGIEHGEVWVFSMHIAPYQAGSYTNVDSRRPRKLLLHKQEIRRLIGKVNERGMTLIPLSMYFRKGRAKLEIGLCRGKKAYDKREDIAKRDADRDVAREVFGRDR